MKYEKGSFITVPNINYLQGHKGNLQALFMWICKYADKDGRCFPSRKQLSKDLLVTKQTIDTYISKLCDLGLIEKTSRFRDGRQTTNLYQILIKDSESGQKNNTGGDEKSNHIPDKKDARDITKPSKEVNPPNKETSQKEVSEEVLVNKIIKLFKDVNPSYLKFFRNKTQREAIKELIRIHGIEQIERVINILPKTNSIQYLPVITTPIQLFDKWASLEAGLKKKSLEINKKKSSIGFF